MSEVGPELDEDEENCSMEEETMMRVIGGLMVLGGLVAGLMFSGSFSRGGRSILVPTMHADEGCSVATLRGSYGFYRQGTTGVATSNANALAAVGITTFDGAGNTVAPAHQAISKNGAISDFSQPAGIGGFYQVSSDCTGQLILSDGVTPVADFVIVDGGNGLYALSLTAGNAVIEVARRVQPSEQ